MTDARKPILAGNWKMHHTHLDAIQVVQKLSYQLEERHYDEVDIVVCPAFTALRSVQTTLDADRIPISLGAQDVHWADEGAFTGEISPVMLAKLNVSYVVVGHSERRQLFGESDEAVNKKVKAVLGHGMTPIMCVGESLDQREEGETRNWVTGQVKAGLAGVKAEDVALSVIAYEPIWAIGTGKTATADDAEETIGWIRESVGEAFGSEAASAVRVQYGGSVKPGNIAELMSRDEIDGALVGGASLDPDDFARIIRYAD